MRADNGGLPELRSVVMVGPDEVIPQARVEDRTAIGNESEYADDATVDRNGDGSPDDSAVSAAFRLGYMLSDDPYGDFDPTEFGFSPDVALGRMVETPQQIEAQAQAFLDAEGIVEPQRSFVTGYDFLSDGATEIFDSLSGAVPGGSSAEPDRRDVDRRRRPRRPERPRRRLPLGERPLRPLPRPAGAPRSTAPAPIFCPPRRRAPRRAAWPSRSAATQG